jgi:GNAT superfamily N-acetyltransferase
VIAVRRATPADVPAMSRVLTASIRDLCTADHRNDPERLDRWLANKTEPEVTKMLANPRAGYFIAERDGIVAAVGCVLEPDEVGLNYVDPAHRFAGVSKALLAAMEADVAANGQREAKLMSTGTAHRFYEASGWHDAGGPEDHNGMLCYPMRKTL